MDFVRFADARWLGESGAAEQRAGRQGGPGVSASLSIPCFQESAAKLGLSRVAADVRRREQAKAGDCSSSPRVSRPASQLCSGGLAGARRRREARAMELIAAGGAPAGSSERGVKSGDVPVVVVRSLWVEGVHLSLQQVLTCGTPPSQARVRMGQRAVWPECRRVQGPKSRKAGGPAS